MKAMQLIIATLALSASNAGSYELKGITMGMSQKGLEQRFPGLSCTQREMDKTVVECEYQRVGPSPNVTDLNSVAEVLVNYWRFWLYDDRLGTVLIGLPSEGYSDVHQAMVAKFGEPKTKESAVQNRMGASFAQREHIWLDASSRLVLSKYSSSLDSSSLTFTAPWTSARSKKADQSKGLDKAKDL